MSTLFVRQDLGCPPKRRRSLRLLELRRNSGRACFRTGPGDIGNVRNQRGIEEVISGLCDLLFYDTVPLHLAGWDGESGHVGAYTFLGRGAPAAAQAGEGTPCCGRKIFASFAPGPPEVSVCELFTKGRASVLKGRC